ncbi:hypothetical protein DFQ26_006621, partial [Actinomortierella ambigua]
MGPARNSVGQVGRLDHPLEGNAGASHRRRQSRRQSRRDQHTPGTKQAVTKDSDGRYHPLTPSSPEDSSVFDNGAVQGGSGSGEGGGLIRLRPSATTKATAGANADNVILDMTGYKTDDSDDLSDGETIVFREHHHLHRRRQRSPFMAMTTDNTSSGSTGESQVQKSAYRKTRGMRGIGEVATALLATSSASPSSASSSFEDDNDDDEDEEEDEEEDEGDDDEDDDDEVALKEQQSRRIASRLPCPASRNNAGSGSTNSPRLGWPGRERSNSLPNLHQLAVSDRMDMTSMMTTALRELHGQADAVNDKERKATMMMMAMKEKKEIDDDEDKDNERQKEFNAVDSAIASSVSVTPSSAKGSAAELPSPHVPPLPPSMPAVVPPGTTTSHRAALGMHHHRKPSSVRVNQAMNALSDTELEYQTPRVTSATGSAEWTWGWGGLPVKHNAGMDDDDEERHGQDASAANRERAGEVSPKPVLREMEIGGQVYRLAISMCPGDDFGKDL